MTDSIIDHRPIRRFYGAWCLTIVLTVVLFGLGYILEYTTPWRGDISYVPLISCLIIALAGAVLAILFKQLFRQAMVAWLLCIGIAGLGFFMLLHYGWSWWWLGWWGVTIVLELVLGPYLHFQ